MTTTPDFRALAQELFKHARQAQAILIGEGLWDVDDDEGLFDRADKALATPPPEPPPYWPTQGEVIQLAMDTRLYRFQATAGDPIQYEMTEAQLIVFARAVLERWGK